MAKKLSEIANLVDSSVLPFMTYLGKNIDIEFISLIERLSKLTDVYIFSGVIRNFFLGADEIRDIDIILGREINIESHFKSFEIKKNSYGGYKFTKGNFVIDLWFLEKTWAFQYQKTFDFDLSKYIPSTAFFNFSSIVFSYNEKRFDYTINFLRFLRDKEIDVVYEPNANYALCIVNTFYYADRFNLKISDNLKKHIYYLNRNLKNKYKYEEVQLKHFGQILYSTDKINSRIFHLNSALFMQNA